MKKTRNPASYTSILISNYKSGDFKILSDIARKYKSEDIIESLAFSYTDIFNANPTDECKTPLEILYSKTNCGIHRNEIVQILIKNNVLSEKIKKEIKYDSYIETRKLVENIS